MVNEDELLTIGKIAFHETAGWSSDSIMKKFL